MRLPGLCLVFGRLWLLAVAEEPVGGITVAGKLQARGGPDAAGGRPYLGELAQNTPSASNIRAYAQVVRERASLRKLIEAAQEIADSGFNPEGRQSNELIDEAERRIMQIAEEGPKAGGPQDVNPLLKQAPGRWLLYNSPSPRDRTRSRRPYSACKKK